MSMYTQCRKRPLNPVIPLCEHILQDTSFINLKKGEKIDNQKYHEKYEEFFIAIIVEIFIDKEGGIQVKVVNSFSRDTHT